MKQQHHVMVKGVFREVVYDQYTLRPLRTETTKDYFFDAEHRRTSSFCDIEGILDQGEYETAPLANPVSVDYMQLSQRSELVKNGQISAAATFHRPVIEKVWVKYDGQYLLFLPSQGPLQLTNRPSPQRMSFEHSAREKVLSFTLKRQASYTRGTITVHAIDLRLNNEPIPEEHIGFTLSALIHSEVEEVARELS